MSTLYETVTNAIIAQMTQGTAPWQKPWTENSLALTIPKNATTNAKYRGINIPLLWFSADAKRHTTNEWASFNQWRSNGEFVARDEKGTLIIYYDTMVKEKDGEPEKIPFVKSSYVFNRCQLKGFTPEAVPTPEPKPLVERIARVDAFVANTKAVIEYKGDRACYIPSKDKILMPPFDSFNGTSARTATEAAYSTLAHELVHWSGHSSRCNRDLKNRFGTKSYAFEELIAELGAAFLAAELEITNYPRPDHASYLASWLEVLQEDKRAIFRAASEATKALDYLATIAKPV